MGWPGWHVPPLGLWNFHQPVKELKSAGKIFIECPYDFASEVRYTVNVRKFELVKKNVPPLGLCLRYAYVSEPVWPHLSILRTTRRFEDKMNPPVLTIINTLHRAFPPYHWQIEGHCYKKFLMASAFGGKKHPNNSW